MLNLFLTILCQYRFDPVSGAELSQRALQSSTRAYERSENDHILADKREFQEKYEAMGRAMEKFTSAYNAGKGNVWPKKEADALAKAIRELEKTSAWRPVSRKSDGQTLSFTDKKARNSTE